MLEKKDNLNAKEIRKKLQRNSNCMCMSVLHPLHIISGAKHKNGIVIIREILMENEV